ncbi:MAG: E2/UBC family protein [Pirellulaceae bacterium]
MDNYFDDDDDCLHRHLKQLSEYYPLWLDNDYRFVIVQKVRLPPAYNYDDIDFLIELPPDYPLSPPGIGDYRIYTSPYLLFRGCELKDLHPTLSPTKYYAKGFGPWAWFCYEEIKWFPPTDDLINFIEMVRTDLTNPRLK